jgi:sugar/nucleoside kinase (ribokinase family)
MRWLQLSDIHFHSGRPGPPGADAAGDRSGSLGDRTWQGLLDHVSHRTRAGLGPDIILICGDLTWDGTGEGFRTAVARVEQLLGAARLEAGACFVVPGNHDVHQPGPEPEPALGASLHAAWPGSTDGASPADRRRAARHEASLRLDPRVPIACAALANYATCATGVMRHVTPVSETALTWHATAGPDSGRVAIVGMNTAWASCRSDIEEHAALPCGAALAGEAMTQAMAGRPAPRLCLLLGHHPAASLYDFDDVVEQARRLNVALIYLRGHVHGPAVDPASLGSTGFVEVSAGAIAADPFSMQRPPHRVTWGSFDGRVVEFESRIRQEEAAGAWVLDTSAFPAWERHHYRLRATLEDRDLKLAVPRSSAGPPSRLDFVGIGLSAVSTVASLASDPASDPDRKADVRMLWEPELGTFAPFAGTVLARFNRQVGLVTSMGDDEAGRTLRGLLAERGIRLLLCASVPETGRQIALTPKNADGRWNIDRQIDRGVLTARESRILDDVVPDIVAARWLAFDKYELQLVERVFGSRAWREAEARPLVLFETGSRPLRDTRATVGGARVRGLVELSDTLTRNVDLFTTTREWVAAVSDGSLDADALDWNGVTRLLRLAGNDPRPRGIVLTLGSGGARVVTRDSARTITIRKDAALETTDRRGAGDVLRAVAIEALLRERDPLKVDAALGDCDALSSLTEAAQDAVACWLTRAQTADYLGDFPARAEAVLRHRYPEAPG